jgi:hypothetical protein
MFELYTRPPCTNFSYTTIIELELPTRGLGRYWDRSVGCAWSFSVQGTQPLQGKTGVQVECKMNVG